ncbi:MAG TPA: photosynthetic complex assembly protein PuhC [Steroidobacteraceae bacterium]|nr:photosynthetic complex assembly protein PuhC [Steroidobacteraceae bacterium]
MSDPFAERPFPRAALLGAAVLIALSIGMAAMGRFADVGTTRMPTAAVVKQRQLKFEDQRDGSIAVYDAEVQRRIALLAPGTNGFLRGVLRGMVRERRSFEIGAQTPFVLTRWADGRLSITDPAIGRQINLEVFGASNFDVFARLLTASVDRS